MAKLFRKSMFGGFHKQDVIEYIEASSAKQKEAQDELEARLQEQQGKEKDLLFLLQDSRLSVVSLKEQLAQAQEQATSLRKEADSAENRGAEARIRVQELEEALAAAKAEGDTLREEVSKQQDCTEAMEALATRCQGLEGRCAALQHDLDERQRQMDELKDALAFQQAENDRLQKGYAAMLQRPVYPAAEPRQEFRAPVTTMQAEQEDLLYLRREIQRMRDSYDALVLSVLSGNRQPDAETERREDLLVTINHQMDRALGYLEKLVDLQDAQPEEPAKAQPVAQHIQKERERLPMTMEEILRMVRGNR